MNKSHAIHLVFGCLFILVVGFALNDWLAGYAFACAWFISREHTQIQQHLKPKGGSVEDIPLWAGMDVLDWSADAKLDAGVVLVGGFILYAALLVVLPH